MDSTQYLNRLLSSSFFLIVILLLNSCDKPEVTVYEIPKETSEITENFLEQPPVNTPQSKPDTQALPIFWQVPDSWESKMATKFRKGSFLATTQHGVVDISVISFPGDTGGLVNNINRWLGQVGLSPIQDVSVDSRIEIRKLEDRYPLYTMFLEGSSKSILGAILVLSEETWFFKGSGSTAAVSSQKENFQQMILSLGIR